MENFKKVKNISLIIVIIMVLQLVFPTGFTGAETINIVPKECIQKITVLTKQPNGSLKDITEINNYQPRNGDTVTLKFDIVLEAGHGYGDGYKLTYELPPIFANATGSGNLGTVGTYKIEGGKVVVTFNSSIRDDLDQGVEVKDASFSIGANYSETNELLEYTLKLPGNEDIQLLFKPVGGNAITKEGKPENSGKSSNFISWVVDINTELNTLSNASFKDVLIQQTPGKHTYIQNSLKVYELNVNAKGDISLGNPATVTAVYNAENTELSFNLPDGKKAYRVEYNTKMDENDSDAGSATYTNKASLINNGVPESAPVTSETVTWGPPLEKSVSGYNSYGASANWVVKYNYNRKTISEDKAKLIDKITGNHKINDASVVKVYNENNVEISSALYNVTLDTDQKGYTLEFNQEVNEPYQIKYTTIKTDYFMSNGEVSNKVTRENDSKESETSFRYSNPAIVKNALGIDYKNKTIEWEIKVNQDSYPMKDIIITDTYAGEGMKFKVDSLEVIGLTAGQYTFTDNGTLGFTFQVTTGTTISTPFTIKFKTDYKIDDVGNNNRTYKNTSDIEWYVGAKKYNSSSSDEANINKEQKESGYKKGVYDYGTKEFKWTVVINYNNNTLEKAIFKDTLPDGQKLNFDSIVVRPVTLKSDGTIDLRLAPISPAIQHTDKFFEIAFSQITEPYEITYTSVDEDGIFPKTNRNVKVKNAAELWNDTTKNASWSDEVTVAYTNETIKKEGKGFNQTSLIDWNFKLNYSQSQLFDVKIVDTVGKDSDGNPNQFILEDSFKVYEVKLTGVMKSGIPSETKTLVTGIYDVVVDNVNGTFTLTFNQPVTKAYYIEYQSIFLGAPNESVSNTAKLAYNGITNGIEETSSKDFNYWFSGSGSTKKVQLKLIKEDKDSGKKLEGAKFALYNYQNNIKLTDATTDENGEILFPYKLGEGRYKLVEIEAPTGYLKNADMVIDLKVSSSTNGIQTETIENTKIRQAIELTKTDVENNPLEGVEFELRLKDGQGNYNIVPLYKNLKTNADGKIYVGDLLTPGDYQLIETKAKDGYWLDSKPVDFKITKDQTVATSKKITNTKQGNLIINKMDSGDNKPLQGAIFKLYAFNDTTFTTPLYTSLKTGVDGKTEFTNVKYGDYILKETTAPSGYVVKPSDDGNKITINSASQNITVKNERINQAVKLTKVDVDNNNIKLAGAVFTLHHSDGTLVEKDKEGVDLPKSFTTDENGEIAVNKLTPGNYYFIEKEAPDYYLQPVDANKKTIEFTITQGQTSFTNVEKTNKRGKGNIIIKKVDSTDSTILLEGVEFILTNSDGTITKTSSTDTNGKIEFTNLPYDTYTLTEKTAHKDYVLSALPEKVVLNGEIDGTLKEVTVENTKKDHSVKLIKYNGDKTLKLKGAIFELRKEIAGVYEVVTGINVDKLTTDDNGEINLTDLPVGKYQLIEISAADGYRLNSDPVEFEILENQTTVTIVEKLNSRKPSGGGDKPEIPKVPEVNPGTKVANILINKVDEKSNPLEGAEFTLYDENGIAIRTAVSDSSGKVLFDNLSLGEYSIHETKAPENYELEQEAINVNITESTTYSYTFTNVLSETINGNSGNTENSNSGGSKTEIDKPNGQTTLPNTGSIFNTTLLAIIGLILIITGIVSFKLNKIRS